MSEPFSPVVIAVPIPSIAVLVLVTLEPNAFILVSNAPISVLALYLSGFAPSAAIALRHCDHSTIKNLASLFEALRNLSYLAHQAHHCLIQLNLISF